MKIKRLIGLLILSLLTILFVVAICIAMQSVIKGLLLIVISILLASAIMFGIRLGYLSGNPR